MLPKIETIDEKEQLIQSQSRMEAYQKAWEHLQKERQEKKGEKEA